MRVSINWLKKYVDFDCPVDELAHRLTMAGIAVEGVEEIDDDKILVLELTPNRGDCYGIINTAREVAALFESKVMLPEITLQENNDSITDYINIVIKDEDLCGRYTARLIKNCNITDSPEWMQKSLISAGIRPVNNIVDITNYVMLEYNQPLHAFDYDLLGKNDNGKQEIIIRRAAKNERIVTLDGIERELNETMLLITDPDGPIAIAGTMGGESTEITASTKNVLLESAFFNNISVRRTSKTLALRSDSSIRFEKGVDINGLTSAINRAADLVQALAGGEIVGGLADNYPHLVLPRIINLRPERVNSVLGSDLSNTDMQAYLEGLGFSIDHSSNEWRVTVPTYRIDLQAEVDLIEEIARLHGYDNLPATLPEGQSSFGGLNPLQKFKDEIKRFLSNQFNEVINLSFINPNVREKMLWRAENPHNEMLELVNPLSEDYSVMRSTLLPGLLLNISNNQARKMNNLSFFEMGAVFLPQEEGLPTEKPILSAIVTGCCEHNWYAEKIEMDFFYLKGIIEGMFLELGLNDYSFEAFENDSFHSGRTALITANSEAVGIIGEIHPLVAAAFNIKSRVCAFELDVEKLFSEAKQKIMSTEISKFPEIERDLAIIVPVFVKAKEILAQVDSTKSPLLKNVAIFDVYEGNQVPQGCKSLALRFTFSSLDRTLTDSEVNSILETVVAALKENLEAKLR